ncbi:hypothetical protein IMSAGC019_02847 [Lachnospiraceae bacterium]|nr:hypothetical protein IMSAGC019_02847 [Lachnospiraceae bacterium]
MKTKETTAKSVRYTASTRSPQAMLIYMAVKTTWSSNWREEKSAGLFRAGNRTFILPTRNSSSDNARKSSPVPNPPTGYTLI